ncbi:MAG: hypothetical protein KIC46_07400 [Clostridiales bacterium]|nr:hypothetical protein [Clostridiales bacterium]
MIATGATLNLNAHEQEIGSYVCAEVQQGESGILYTQPFRIACEEAPSTPEDIPQYFDWSALLRKITDRTFGLVADIHEGNGIFDAATKLLFGIKL